MPRTKSAEKQLRQSRSHAALNRAQRSQLRTAIKQVRAAAGVAGQDAEAAYAKAVQLLDRAGRKNLIHRNTASRTKARLAKLVNSKKA